MQLIHEWCSCGRALLSLHEQRTGEKCEICRREEAEKKLQEEVNRCHAEALFMLIGY